MKRRYQRPCGAVLANEQMLEQAQVQPWPATLTMYVAWRDGGDEAWRRV